MRFGPARLMVWVFDRPEQPSALFKQSSVALPVLGGVFIILYVPGLDVSNAGAAWAGIAVVGFVTLLAAAPLLRPEFKRFEIVLPFLDVAGLGLLIAGTGGSQSVFSALLILPILWIAQADGRRFAVLASVSTALALTLPYLIWQSPPTTTVEWLRIASTPLVFAIAALIVNELSRQSRRQLRDINRFAEEKERMLQRTVEYAAQLQASEAKFRQFDRLFRGVWAAVTEQSIIGTDVTGLIDAWNPGATKILGPTAEDTEDKAYIFDFHVHDELEERARQLNYPPGETVLNPGFSALVETARLGQAESREWHYVRRDGSLVPVQLSVTKRVDEDGETAGYLFVASDVTQALEVARLKDEFVGLISHELRTPLSSILGYLELMRDDEDDPLSPEHLQYLGVAERNAHRLLRLVGDLLFTAQVESGKFPLDAHEMVIDATVAAAVESARPVAEAAGITVIEVLPETGTVVHGDPVRLGQAVDNLISNAIKFTPRGGRVTVALASTDREVIVTVRDTGMGIAESELDKLFSRFFRATTATRNAVPGVGLGLTITKAIVSAHHGVMGVESEEGVGTCFSLTLPLASTPVMAR